jgi:hypothetical protein
MRLTSKPKNIMFLIFLLLVVNENTKLCSSSKVSKIKKLNLKTEFSQITQVKTFNYMDMLIVKGDCNSNNCKETGQCNNSDCVCNDGYAQDPHNSTPSSSDMRCSYKLKSQALFFLIEMFTWIGIGHFYAGRILHAIVKLAVILFTIITDCFLRNFFRKGSKSWIILYWIIHLLYFFILFWHVFDLVMIALNKYSDGNGMIIRTLDKNQFK